MKRPPTPKVRGKKIGHTTVSRGRKVLLFFRDQTLPHLITKFVEKKGRFIITEAGKFSTEDVYKIAIYRHASND